MKHTNTKILTLEHRHFDSISMEVRLQLPHYYLILKNTAPQTLLNTKNMILVLKQPFILLSNAFSSADYFSMTGSNLGNFFADYITKLIFKFYIILQ